MAKRAFIIPIRNDVGGMGIQITDLQPNSSQRNLIYDGEGQTHYLKYTLNDAENTNPISALAADDTTGGGNDVQATTTVEYGLIAYLRERIHAGGTALATAPAFSEAEANSAAGAIVTRVVGGGSLTVTSLNTLLSGVVANTDFDGAAANSKSFGSVEEILRILQGENYEVPAHTIVENAAGQFLSRAQREALVAAQDTAANGGTSFSAAGSFVAEGSPYYRHIKQVALTGYVRQSAQEGVLAGLAAPGFAFTNPAFTYGAGGTAVTLVQGAIDTDGVQAAVVVYDHEGNVLT